MNKLIVIISLWMMFSHVALAEHKNNAKLPVPGQRHTVAFETDSLNIKLSNDRTGIVQKVACADCDFNIVKITAATKAYANGKEVDLLRAKSRSKKMATVIFYLDTQEVTKITWVE